MAQSLLLDGKIAVISGAASLRGIGMATAKLFAEHGAKIAILDLDETAASEAAALLGADHRGYACNVTDKESCLTAVARVVAEFGGIDVLINNAGITQPVKTLDIDPASWDRILDVNLRGVLYLSQAVLPHLQQRGGGAIAGAGGRAASGWAGAGAAGGASPASRAALRSARSGTVAVMAWGW